MAFQSQHGKKVHETLSQQKKLDVVVRACHFSCGGNHKMEGWWYTLAPGKK
jgi:hypothetical protein